MELSRRSLLQWGVGGAAAAIAGVALGDSASATGSTAAARFPGDPGPGRLYYGASTEQSVTAWEQQLGRRLALHRTYYQANEPGRLVRTAKADLAVGRLPHVSTKVPGDWAGIARGKHDSWLRGIAGGLDRLERPVFLTLHHEPENDRHKGSAHDFVAMQEHAITLFAKRAPRVTIVPILMGWSFSPYNRRANPAAWYVHSAKVYGVDVYNPYCESDPKWVEFSDKIDEVKRYAHGKPIAIGEYGCRNDPSDPDRATQWMRDAFHYARRNNIVSMSYFNSGRNSPEGSWRLEGGRSRVFQHRLASTAVVHAA